MLSSIDRLASASTSTERIALIRVASTPPSCSATSAGIELGCRPAKGVPVDRVGDRAPQHERRPRLGGEQIDVVDDAEQLPCDERTGTWRIPRSSMVNISSAPVCSAPAVNAGALITSSIGVCRERPAATTRERRS